jgi:nucleoside-triphosphatase
MANHLVTGPPRSGKTTVLRRTAELLDRPVGGVVTPERRDGEGDPERADNDASGERVGFECRDLLTGETATIAHVDYDGPQVGKYGVDVAAIDRVAVPAIERATSEERVVLIDEVAPMQRHSDRFLDAVEAAFEGAVSVLAAVESGREGVVGEYKSRPDTTVWTVTPADRDALPERLAGRL